MKLKITKRPFQPSGASPKKRNKLVIHHARKQGAIPVKPEKRLALNDPRSADYNPALNKAGTSTGIHNRLNPPDPEYMKKIRAMRKFYSPKMPCLQCNLCSFSSACPQFKAGYECAFLPFLNSHKIDTTDDLLHYMKELLSANMRRAHLSMMMETLTGAPPSPELSESLNLAFAQLTSLHDKMSESTENILELETDDNSIIGKIFGSLVALQDDTKNAVEEAVEVEASVISSAELDTEKQNRTYNGIELPPTDTDLLNDFQKSLLSSQESVIVSLEKKIHEQHPTT